MAHKIDELEITLAKSQEETKDPTITKSEPEFFRNKKQKMTQNMEEMKAELAKQKHIRKQQEKEFKIK